MSVSTSPVEVLLAPVLRAEGWTSIDLLMENYLACLSGIPDLHITNLAPAEHLAKSRMGKRLVRDALYPSWIKGEARSLKAESKNPVLHVIDHSYAHLCRAWNPCVLTVNDLNHFTAPALSGIALWRWRKRVEGMKHADRIVAISGQLASEVHEHVGIPMERITVAHYGIDRGVFRPQPRDAVRSLVPQLAKLPDETLFIVNIGSNIPRKNLPTLLKAIAQLKAKGLPVKLVKVGHPLHSSEHAALIAELKLEADVLDLGSIPPEQVAAVCAYGHALSFPTTYEGFGRPTVEAQACGLPCALSNASCMKEIGGDGALYHEPYDVEQLAHQLQQALTDSTTRDKLCEAGLRNADRFSWANHASKLAALYRELGA